MKAQKQSAVEQSAVEQSAVEQSAVEQSADKPRIVVTDEQIDERLKTLDSAAQARLLRDSVKRMIYRELYTATLPPEKRSHADFHNRKRAEKAQAQQSAIETIRTFATTANNSVLNSALAKYDAAQSKQAKTLALTLLSTLYTAISGRELKTA